jgi:hypothetical protein
MFFQRSWLRHDCRHSRMYEVVPIWWYQRVSYSEIKFMSARHWRLNLGISQDRTFASGSNYQQHRYVTNAGTSENETSADTERTDKKPLSNRTLGKITYSMGAHIIVHTRRSQTKTRDLKGKFGLVWFDLGFALVICFGFGESSKTMDFMTMMNAEVRKMMTVNTKVRNRQEREDSKN